MFALLRLLVALISNRLKSRRWLEVENLNLRHQLNIALRRAPHGPRLRGLIQPAKSSPTSAHAMPTMASMSKIVFPAARGRSYNSSSLTDDSVLTTRKNA